MKLTKSLCTLATGALLVGDSVRGSLRDCRSRTGIVLGDLRDGGRVA